jgi:hypothetical protein
MELPQVAEGRRPQDMENSCVFTVTCYATEDAFQIINWFYYNVTNRHYNYLLHCYLLTQLTRQSLQLIRSSFRLFSITVT